MIKDNIKKVINITISILSIFGLFYLMRWAGLKGILSFLVGMIIMAYLILSNNLIMRSVVTLFGAERSIKEIMDETNEEKQKDNQKEK